ncbi:GNAT family N-acetyltransferase [Chelativorans sp. Marseille-P2723]|uniref:GNAT family N-acetyltransferase n=1 Tax=Chelativorans sp. Marseille-P2723 TaxID=2709133 RepID=UPI00156F4B96|nr:GNAT family N-acetyltransferase [Chelativorans sp. Marseille-P2723]
MPHLRARWGEAETELSISCGMVEGRDRTEPFPIHVEWQTGGYIQPGFVRHHQNDDWLKEPPGLKELAPAGVGIDRSIGDAKRLSRGIGSAASSAFIGKLLAEGHKDIIVDHDAGNLRALNVYRKAGFRQVPSLFPYLEERTGAS